MNFSADGPGQGCTSFGPGSSVRGSTSSGSGGTAQKRTSCGPCNIGQGHSSSGLGSTAEGISSSLRQAALGRYTVSSGPGGPGRNTASSGPAGPEPKRTSSGRRGPGQERTSSEQTDLARNRCFLWARPNWPGTTASAGRTGHTGRNDASSPGCDAGPRTLPRGAAGRTRRTDFFLLARAGIHHTTPLPPFSSRPCARAPPRPRARARAVTVPADLDAVLWKDKPYALSAEELETAPLREEIQVSPGQPLLFDFRL